MSASAGTVGGVAAELARQAGVPVAVPAEAAGKAAAAVKDAPFWEALDKLAAGAGLRVALRDAGRAVDLVPAGMSREVVSTAGPFRVVARQVVGRALLADGFTVHEVQLGVHWEPRYPVFRIDTHPHVTTAADDRGTALQPQPAGGRTQPAGSEHEAVVRLGGVTRAAGRIGTLAGHFTVTASEKLHAFRFDAAAPKGAPVEKEGVRATLTRWVKDGDTWEAEFDLLYPASLPEFESFEATAFTAANRARLVGPGGKAFDPSSPGGVNAVGRRVTATYYFKEDRAKGLAGVGRGWAVELDAAATPVEFRVPFALRDVPLP